MELNETWPPEQYYGFNVNKNQANLRGVLQVLSSSHYYTVYIADLRPYILYLSCSQMFGIFPLMYGLLFMYLHTYQNIKEKTNLKLCGKRSPLAVSENFALQDHIADLKPIMTMNLVEAGLCAYDVHLDKFILKVDLPTHGV